MHALASTFVAVVALVGLQTAVCHKQEFMCYDKDTHHQCLNGGVCIYNSVNILTCDCSDTGHRGLRCEIPNEPCTDADCKFGSCVDSACQCLEGYAGASCNETADIPDAQRVQVSQSLFMYNASHDYAYNEKYCRDRGMEIPSLQDVKDTFVNASGVMLAYGVTEMEAQRILDDHIRTFNLFVISGTEYTHDTHEGDEYSYSSSSSSSDSGSEVGEEEVVTVFWLRTHGTLCATMNIKSTESGIQDIRVLRQSCYSHSSVITSIWCT